MTRRAVVESGRKVALNMKTTPEFRARLEVLAAASGRSLTHEVEYQLERAIRDDDAMRVIRETIRQEMRAEFAARQALQTEIEAAQRKMVFDMHETARREREATPARNGDWGYGLGLSATGD